MNVLYCGDKNIEDGLIISVLSLLGHVTEQLNIMVFTMSLETGKKTYEPVSEKVVLFLDQYVKRKNESHCVKLVDVTEIFQKEIPLVNINTRFTPYCMLRLFADEIPDMPNRVLYLDNDVVCRMDVSDFYHQPIQDYELAGVLDHYGKWFFRKHMLHSDYINSGVLLLNLEKIRKTGVFARCRSLCRHKKMFMPDQSAINKLAASKKVCDRRYNEQRRLHENTVLQHFTTSFRLFPWLHTLTVKPWQIDRMHSKLKIFSYDDILAEYKLVKEWIGGYSQ